MALAIHLPKLLKRKVSTLPQICCPPLKVAWQRRLLELPCCVSNNLGRDFIAQFVISEVEMGNKHKLAGKLSIPPCVQAQYKTLGLSM